VEFVDEQASSRVELSDGTVLDKCSQCRELWQERNQRGIEGDPPCSTCQVNLDPENAEVAEVYMTCRGQVITRGMDGQIIDISLPAVESAMRMIGVQDQRKCLAMVRRVFYHFLEGQNGAGI
jgi:hypothetical protein